ncbi:MAG: methyltransferase domain-containing protein [Luteitalea sp.]|nr:methyltransferase domain-containing protein [Luteitalea sp.]
MPEPRALCVEHAQRGDYHGWFDARYREASDDDRLIQWADMVPNPHLLTWHQRSAVNFRGKRCLTIGCGLGDDAEYLGVAGGDVMAFDISATAISWCRKRFAGSPVAYVEADLLGPPDQWRRRFTSCSSPTRYRSCLSMCVQTPCSAPRNWWRRTARCWSFAGDETPPREMPWPLTTDELRSFSVAGVGHTRGHTSRKASAPLEG